MRVLIVGGVAAGASAAARIRRLDETAEIVMFERGPYISFANCGLPYYVGGVIVGQDKILIQTPESMKGRFNIDVRTNSEVISVDPDRKTIRVVKGGVTTDEAYDALVLAPGAKPLAPPIPGIEDPRVLYMRNVDDANRMKQRALSAKSAVVIGGGFIGIEAAENFDALGLQVTLVESAPHIIAPLDSDMSPILERELEENGVHLILNNGVTRFEDTDAGLKIVLADGQSVTTDLCLLAIGVRPDTEWLRNSTIALDPRGYIRVDDRMRTNLPDVYAAGDAVLTKNLITGKDAAFALAGPANRQGRIAADNIIGVPSTYSGSIGTSVIKVFALTAAATGANERLLTTEKIPYQTVHLHPKNHADYYPGACEMDLKVLYGADEKILGAQAVSREGADKFIDVIATVIKMGGTLQNLEELELAYAPAYLSAKSPANYAGFAARNELSGYLQSVPASRLDALGPDELSLDVRRLDEYEKGTVGDSLHIPLNDLRGRLAELSPYRNKTLFVFCATGIRSYIACRMLTQHGFKVRNVKGGYRSYIAAKFVPGSFH